MTTTSSQRPNLRPTSRSVPTISKPSAGVQADRRVVAADDAGHHGVEAVGGGQRHQLGRAGTRPTPWPCWSRRT